jgi:DNA-binding response OmpR family regulator
VARILVIDDEDLVRYSIRMFLEADGHDVDEAEDGLAGLAKLEAGSYDLLITDIVMPRKEGMETILEVRESRPDLKILAISGGGPTGSFNYVELTRQCGADLFVAKPFTDKELLGAVRELLP